MNYFILPNGNLLFTVTPEFVLENRDEIEDITYVTDLLEMTGMLGNGYYDATDKIGLTFAMHNEAYLSDLYTIESFINKCLKNVH